MIKGPTTDKGKYNLRDALIKKINFKNSSRYYFDLYGFTDRNLHNENMKLVREFIEENEITEDLVSKNSDCFLHLFHFMKKYSMFVLEYLEKVDPILNKYQNSKKDMESSLVFKSKLLADKENSEESIKNLNEEIEQLEEMLQE